MWKLSWRRRSQRRWLQKLPSHSMILFNDLELLEFRSLFLFGYAMLFEYLSHFMKVTETINYFPSPLSLKTLSFKNPRNQICLFRWPPPSLRRSPEIPLCVFSFLCLPRVSPFSLSLFLWRRLDSALASSGPDPAVLVADLG